MGVLILFGLCAQAQFVKCQVCKTVVAGILFEMGTPQFQNFTLHEIEKVCKITPPVYYQLCVLVLNETAQNVIELIVNNANPDDICATIGLCKPSADTQLSLPSMAIWCDIIQQASNLQMDPHPFINDQFVQ